MDNKNSYTYKKYRKNIKIISGVAVLIGLIAIIFLWYSYKTLNGTVLLIAAIAIIVIIKIADEVAKAKIKRNYRTWGRGAGAELKAGRQLERLGEDYKIIHDINSGRGNVDHVCVGPTGIFVIETKAHRGVVSYTNQILINGKQLEKDYLRQTAAEVRFISQFLHERLGGVYQVQGILLFPHGKIDTSIRGPKEGIWIGGAGFANYVIRKGSSTLKPAELAAITQLLQGLKQQK